MIRSWITAGVVIALETVLYVEYAQLDGEFHFWLHGLIGAAVGLAALAAARLLSRRRGDESTLRPRMTPWEAAFLGHFYSALPDILFLGGGVLHDNWMDVFAFHITAHFVPAPILTALVLFLLALAAYVLAMAARPRAAQTAAVLGLAGFLATAALFAAAPVPDDIQDLRSSPRLAWHHVGGQH
jgi:ABC-type Na+ efflux pump permease subunit